MIQRFRNWILGIQEKGEEPVSPEVQTHSDSVFSRDLYSFGPPHPEKTINFDSYAPNLTPIKTTDGESIAFDEAISSSGMDSNTLKQAFNFTSSIPSDLYNWYATQGFIGYQACALISQQWLINKAISLPAKDALKNGYEIVRADGEELDVEALDQIKTLDKEFKIEENLYEMETNKRRFGIRLCLFCVESKDDEYYKKPFNIDGVKPGSYKGISQVDPNWIAPILDQSAIASPASMDFYEPTWWQINGKLYHKSHFFITRYVELPDTLKPNYYYGGLPLTQLLLERVYAAERIANEAPMLAETKRTNVIYADLASIAANPGSFADRLKSFIGYRSNYGVYVAGQDDKVEQQDTSLADLDDLIMTQYQLVSAISGVPATKLLGTSPKGFSSTGEYEQDSYYDLLESIQNDMGDFLSRHYELLVKSIISPEDPFCLSVTWNPLRTPSATEQATINLNNAQTDSQLQMTGAIDGYDIRNRLIKDPNSGYNGLEEADENLLEDLDDEDL